MTPDHLIRPLNLPNILLSSWLERILDYDNMTSTIIPMLIALIAVFFPIVKTFNKSKTIELYFFIFNNINNILHIINN